MSTKNQLSILLLVSLVYFLIGCKKNNNPIEEENKSPSIVSDAWISFPNSPGNPVWAMSVSSDGVLYAGIKGGLVRSFDNGLNWELIYSSGTPNVIYISPYDSMIILSLTGTFNTTTVYSTDNGLTWKESIVQPYSSSIRHYLALPTGEILARGYIHDESSGGIFISKDKGVTWKRIPDFTKGPSVRSFALSSTNDIYAVISSGFLVYTTDIYCSKDKGQSWLIIPKPDSSMINALLINRSNAFLTNTDKSVFISESNTVHWNSIYSAVHDGFIHNIGLDSNDNLFVTFFDLEDGMTKVLLLSALNNKWYSIEGLNLPVSEGNITTLIGKDHHIYIHL